MVDIEEEIRSLQLDSSGTIPGTHFSINSSCGDLRFKAVGLFLYLLFIIYFWAEDNNGVVNPEAAKLEQIEESDKMDVGG